MALSEETRLVIKDTAYEVAEVVCQRYEKQTAKELELHEANCAGRRVGKGIAIIFGAAAAAGGTSIVLWVKSVIAAAQAGQ